MEPNQVLHLPGAPVTEGAEEASEDVIVLQDVILHRLMRRSTTEEQIGTTGDPALKALRFSTGAVLEPLGTYESRGGGLTIRVTYFDAPPGRPGVEGLTVDGRKVVPILVEKTMQQSGVPGIRSHTLPPLAYGTGQAVHVVLEGDVPIGPSHIRAVRFYDADGQPLAPTHQLRMLNDHPGVLALLPTTGAVDVRVEAAG